MDIVKQKLFWRLFHKYLLICTLIAVPLAVFIQITVINSFNGNKSIARAQVIGPGSQLNSPVSDAAYGPQYGQDILTNTPSNGVVPPGYQIGTPNQYIPPSSATNPPVIGPGQQLNPPQPSPQIVISPGQQLNPPQPSPQIVVAPGSQLNPPQPPVTVPQPSPLVVQPPQPVVVTQPAPVIVKTEPVVQKVVSPPVCTEQPSQYPQCGGTCNGITYPADHTVMVTKGVDNLCHETFQCVDLGVKGGQCGNQPQQVPVSTEPEVSYSTPAQPIQVAIQPTFQQLPQSQQQSQLQSQNITVQTIPAPVSTPTVAVTSVTQTTTPVVTTITKTVPAEQLPQTGPAAAGILLTFLIPLGLKLRSIKSSHISPMSANTQWQNRQLKH